MTSAFEEQEEPRDRTRYIWIGVTILFVLMVGVLWYIGRPDPKVSTVRARHILIQFDQNDATDRARALELTSTLRERIERGASFSRVAREYSNDPSSAARGGDLGYWPKGTFVPEFEEYVWSAAVGELSEVIETSHGFHLIRVEHRHLSPADAYEQELEKRAREELERGNSTSEPTAP
jgi:parvulin-like peptidyl-prolyl isomerase